jgi:hypothetical protein
MEPVYSIKLVAKVLYPLDKQQNMSGSITSDETELVSNNYRYLSMQTVHEPVYSIKPVEKVLYPLDEQQNMSGSITSDETELVSNNYLSIV